MAAPPPRLNQEVIKSDERPIVDQMQERATAVRLHRNNAPPISIFICDLIGAPTLAPCPVKAQVKS